MRRLPGILLLTVATLIVIVALLVSGLRLVLPQLDAWRPQLLEKISTITGTPVDASQITASWQTFGPTLDARDIHVGLKDGGTMAVKRVTLALDVWQSLLHMRWQFRDLTFWQLQVHTNTPIQTNDGGESLKTDRISDLFLRQFDHFTLRDSHLSFLTLSGQRAELAVPQLTWLNGRNRHRAEGQLSLSSLTGQHGVMQVRMDLRDEDGLLNKGRVWLQADDIDVKPWLGRWMQDNIALKSARFSLEGWMTIEKGDVASGDVWLKKGGASWQGDNEVHHLSVDNLTAHLSHDKQSWAFYIPDTRIAIDDKPWPSGALAMAWIPAQDVGGDDRQRSDELRIRASNLALSGLSGLQPFADKLAPSLGELWRTTQPGGKINLLALDIPLQATEKTRFQAQWSDLAWKQWKLLPGAEHFSGSLNGSVEHGELRAHMAKALMPYAGVFRAPLEIAAGEATLSWVKNDKGFMLDGRDIDVQATGVRARGGFRYLQPQGDDPWLGILAGISTNDGGQAWRYFPENLMGKALVDYLSGAIKAGQASDATLVYGGNPHLFPYPHNEGQFQVYVPLKNATFAFQPDWPAVNGDLNSQTLSATWFNQPLNLNFSTREGEKAFLVDVGMNANWQPSRTGLLPKAVSEALSGSVPWDGKVAIELPYHGNASYKVDINGDLKNVSSRLPSPVSKPAGEPLPVKINVAGGLSSFDLTGSIGAKNHINSRWLLNHKLTLDRAILTTDSKGHSPLPDQPGIELNLPPMDGAQWLALFENGAANEVSSSVLFPPRIVLRTPSLALAGQQWNNVSLMSQPVAGGSQVEAQGREINATLTMRDNAPWLANVRYLYFNPASASGQNATENVAPQTATRLDFHGWPDLQLRCAECWLWGQKYGRIDGDVAIKGDTLTLSNGLVDTGFGRLTTNGVWVNAPSGVRTSLKGRLHGNKTDAFADFFGVSTPVKDSPFDIDYDLHWRAPPWSPDVASLNGIIKSHLGKGQFTDLSTGHAGQLLRLLSVDALLRKLRFDFSDTFSEGFYFDSINSTAWIKDGVLHTDDTLVDGLEADIAMKGSVDLVRRQLDLQAVVAPEISATVGVAAAFAVNPIVGAAVFAASKVLGPLWNKVSILRYRITGPIDQPQINEVLRQARSNKKQ